MHTAFAIWLSLRSFIRAISSSSDLLDQRQTEAYLDNVQSTAELEFRERNWAHSH